VNLPNELPAPSAVGGFGGPAAAPASSTSRVPVVSAAGFGTSHASVNGAAKPRPDTARAGFESTSVVRSAPAAQKSAASQSSGTVPVEITFKPRPSYTAEARRLQIEGEVLLQAVFTASGEVQILRIIRGLGHGLNESAIAAARAIRFRPALQSGQPVDSTATVRMSFELAY
jgi:TonB family protein